jgi:signal transduction histidine kinase
MNAPRTERLPPERATHPTRSRRVWVLVTAIWLTGAGMTAVVATWGPIVTDMHIPWPMLALSFAVSERLVLHLRFRQDAHSFSLSEIPLVLALFFVTPLEAATAQLAGAAAVLAMHRKQQPIKLAFNAGQFVLQALFAVIVFRAIIGLGDPLGPIGWLAAVMATFTALVVANALINAAIWLSGGRLSRREIVNVFQLSSLASTANTSLALIAVVLFAVRPDAVWLAATPPIVVFGVYRAYVLQRDESARLDALYEATRALHASPQIESALEAAVVRARRMVDAEYAEALLFPTAEGGQAHATSSGPDKELRVMQRAPDGVMVSMNTIIAATRHGIARGPFEHSTGFGSISIREAVVAPMRVGTTVVGVLVAANRLGDVSSFDEEDARLLDTLAGQVAVSLENGRLEDSLKQLTLLKEQLEALVRSKDEFVASVSHELRTPLTAVVGLAAELRDNPQVLAQEEADELISLIADQSNELADIVEDLLVAGRSEMGELNLAAEVFPLADEVRAVLERTKGADSIEVRHLTDDAEAFGDTLRVRQILRNLVTNAQRYGGDHITVEIGSSRRSVWVTVIDDGDGVPSADTEAIFEPYRRADNAAREPLSVGLGLAVSRRLARLLDGDLTYRRVGGETRFQLTLPTPMSPSGPKTSHEATETARSRT